MTAAAKLEHLTSLPVLLWPQAGNRLQTWILKQRQKSRFSHYRVPSPRLTVPWQNMLSESFASVSFIQWNRFENVNSIISTGFQERANAKVLLRSESSSLICRESMLRRVESPRPCDPESSFFSPSVILFIPTAGHGCGGETRWLFDEKTLCLRVQRDTYVGLQIRCSRGSDRSLCDIFVSFFFPQIWVCPRVFAACMNIWSFRYGRAQLETVMTLGKVSSLIIPCIKEGNKILVICHLLTDKCFLIRWHFSDWDKFRAYNIIQEMNKFSQHEQDVFDGGLFFKEFVKINPVSMVSSRGWKSEVKLFFIN